MDILPLDKHTISLLRSGVYVHSFTHALKSLIEISINAIPNIISTSIDPQSGFISVDDNGIGIDKRLVNLFGRFDSKSLISPPNDSSSSASQIRSYLSLSQHRILDSLAHLSFLDICSRQSDSTHTHQTLFKEGETIFSAPAKTSRRHNRGTTTTVRNLFYSLPVRQIKETDPNRLELRIKRLWNDSKIIIQSLAISNPNITFTLRDSSTNHLTRFDPSFSSSDHPSFFRVSKTGSSSITFGKIFGHQFVRDSIPLDFNIDGYKVNGLFSKNRNASRSNQLIYLDKVLINSNSMLHKTLSDLFARLVSQNASTRLIEHGFVSTQTSSSSKVDRYPVYLILFHSLQEQQEYTSFNKSFFDEKEQDLIPYVEEKLNKIISEIFSQVFPNINALQNQGSTQSKMAKHKQNEINRLTHSGNTLDSRWPVTKRARLSNDLISSKLSPMTRSIRNENEAQIKSNVTESGSSKQKIENKSSSTGLQPVSSKLLNDGRSTKFKYLDYLHEKENMDRKNSPKSDRGRVQVLTPVVPNIPTPNIKQSELSNSNTKSRDKETIGSLKYSNSNSKPAVLGSSEDIMNNQVSKPCLDSSNLRSRFQYKFARNVSQVRSNNKDPPKKPSKVEINPNHNKISSSQQLNSRIENYDSSAELDRIDLSKLSNSSNFTVIGQLDFKFIIVRIHGTSSSNQNDQVNDELIVAFDQHAVHERIRIEKFLKEICTGNCKIKKITGTNNNKENFNFNFRKEKQKNKNEMNKNLKSFKEEEEEDSIPILVNKIELEGFIKYQKEFQRWGIIYKIDKNEINKNQIEIEKNQKEEEIKKIYIIGVPELIWDKIKLEGYNLIKEILKGCLGFFNDRNDNLLLNSEKKN